MSCARVVLATDVGCIAETLEGSDGARGVVLSSLEAGRLAGEIRDCLTPQKMGSMGGYARRYIEDICSPESVRRILLPLITEGAAGR
jgi:hypothetical protein